MTHHQHKTQFLLHSKFFRLARTAVVFVYTLFFAFFPLLAVAQSDVSDLEAIIPYEIDTTEEYIADFQSDIVIHQDSTISVTETIVYDFAQYERHGIFRDIPVVYEASLGKQKIDLSNISVTNSSGESYQFSESKNGNYLRLKIGDPDTLITGQHTYVISYTAARTLGYFEDFDELYWNVTGNEWPVPIASSRAILTLPEGASADASSVACYSGFFGEDEVCDVYTEETDTQLLFERIEPMQSTGGLTIAASFPKGLVYEPTTTDRAMYFFKDNIFSFLFFFVPLAVFVFMYRMWARYGKDAAMPHTVVTQFDIPDKLSAIEVAALMHQNVASIDISAQIISLAIAGYIRIEQIETKILFRTTTDYVLHKLKNADGLPEYDAKIMDSIFGTESTKKLSELKNHFYKSIPQIQSAVGARMLSHHYFVRDPVKDKHKFAIVLVVGLFVLMFGGTFIGSFLGILPSLFLVLSYLIVVFFMYFMPARTPAGATAFMHVKGLKNYLEMAEKERIAFHNAPEKKPEVFEKFLPVAMVLGVEKKWAGQFNDIYTTPPSWYSSSGNGAFNAMVFASSLNDFSTQSASSLATSPGSSSGSGGGGFSGGGGGGGGGGSW